MKQSAALRLVHSIYEPQTATAIKISNLHVWFNDAHILQGIDTELIGHQINCIIGPSGSGKSTLIRSLNRMHDDVDGFKFDGAIHMDSKNISDETEDVAKLRTQIGMVFQKPCVFPKSIAENVLFGIQHQRKLSQHTKLQIVEENLKAAALWEEVKHRLHDTANSLSLGQQQRLCIARTLAVKPKVILFDEPTSSLDPVSTRAIEDLMLELKKDYTIVFVTHNIRQAQRIADQLMFMCNGKIIEQGPKDKLFYHSENEQTKQYLQEAYCEC